MSTPQPLPTQIRIRPKLGHIESEPILSPSLRKTPHFPFSLFPTPPNSAQLRRRRRRHLRRRRRRRRRKDCRDKRMECVFGLVGDGFALVVADTSAVNSILVHKSNEDKIMILDSHKLLGASGEAGDRVQFTEYIQKNLHLYQFRNNIPLTTSAAANFTRGELATALRKNPYFVNILLAGYDKGIGPSLYYIDYIATLHKVEKGAFGYGSYFSLSTMDRHYHPGMSLEEAIDLVDKCILEIRSRLVVAPPNFVIKVVDKDGAREFAWRESIKDEGTAAIA